MLVIAGGSLLRAGSVNWTSGRRWRRKMDKCCSFSGISQPIVQTMKMKRLNGRRNGHEFPWFFHEFPLLGRWLPGASSAFSPMVELTGLLPSSILVLVFETKNLIGFSMPQMNHVNGVKKSTFPKSEQN